MNEQDSARFAAIMAGLQAIFPKDPAVTEAAATIYFDVLKAYPVEAVAGAVRAHLADPERGQFFPKPADLIRQLEGTDAEASIEAWQQARSYLFRGAMSDTIDPKVITAVERMGGRERFRMTLEREEHFVERHFREVYATLNRRERIDRLGFAEVERLEQR